MTCASLKDASEKAALFDEEGWEPVGLPGGARKAPTVQMSVSLGPNEHECISFLIKCCKANYFSICIRTLTFDEPVDAIGSIYVME